MRESVNWIPENNGFEHTSVGRPLLFDLRSQPLRSRSGRTTHAPVCVRCEVQTLSVLSDAAGAPNGLAGNGCDRSWPSGQMKLIENTPPRIGEDPLVAGAGDSLTHLQRA